MVQSETDLRRRASLEIWHSIRSGQRITPCDMGDLAIGGSDLFWDELLWVDVRICGYNRTRMAANRAIRKKLGLKSVVEAGERLTVLKNDYRVGEQLSNVVFGK